MRKKVKGLRIVAALIDSIIIGIVGFIAQAVVILMMTYIEYGALSVDSVLDFFIFGGAGLNFDTSYMWFLVLSQLVVVVIGVLYFALVPYKMNGATLGKRIVNLRASDEMGEPLSFFKHVIRAIQVWGDYLAMLALPLYFLIDQIVAGVVIGFFGVIIFIVQFVSFIMVMAKEDERGLHDMIAGSIVIDVNENMYNQDIINQTHLSDFIDDGNTSSSEVKQDVFKSDEDDDNFWND